MCTIIDRELSDKFRGSDGLVTVYKVFTGHTRLVSPILRQKAVVPGHYVANSQEIGAMHERTTCGIHCFFDLPHLWKWIGRFIWESFTIVEGTASWKDLMYFGTNEDTDDVAATFTKIHLDKIIHQGNCI